MKRLLVAGVEGCAGPFAKLQDMGAAIIPNDEGEVVEVNLRDSQITDAELVDLEGMTKLWNLRLGSTNITDAGLEISRFGESGAHDPAKCSAS